MTCKQAKNLGGRRCASDYLPEATHILLIPKGVEWATLSSMTSVDVVAKINAALPTARLLPFKDVENYAPTEGDAKVQTFDSQRKAFIKRGVMTIAGFCPTGDTITAENFVDLNNLDLGCILMDSEKFQYLTDETKLKVQGIKIAKGSFIAKLVPATSSTVEGIEFSFDIDASVDVRRLRISTFAQLGYSLAEICEPLIPVDNVVISAPLTTSFTMKVYDDRGIPISGLKQEDVTVLNVTTSATVTKTMSESSIGTYNVAYATGVSAGDLLQGTFSATGFDAYGIVFSVQIPNYWI
jgi:hypothetical protein